MTRNIPIHYLKEDSDFNAEIVHLIPSSARWEKLNGYEPHIDDCFTVIVVSKGCGTTDIDYRTVSLSEGEVGIIAPGQIHSNIRVRECEAWILRISPEMIDNDYRRLIDEYSITGEVVALPDDTMNILCDAMALLSRLTDSMNDPRPMKGALFNMLNVILGIITPNLFNSESKALLRSTEIAVNFKRMLPQFVKQQKRPSFYAAQLCISEVYLNEAVKKSTGMTPTEWIAATVVLEAKRLLRATNLSVKEIAQELGFKDYAYFSRYFRRITDMTPQGYRNLK